MNKSEFYVTIKMGVLKRILLIEQKRFQILLKLQTDVSVFDITLPDIETINQSFRLLQSCETWLNNVNLKFFRVFLGADHKKNE